MLHKSWIKKLEIPGILLFKEKHEDRYFYCKTKEEYFQAAFKILKERFEAGWYYEEEDNLDAGEILDEKDLEGAFSFIIGRSDGEYEGVKVVYPEEIS